MQRKTRFSRVYSKLKPKAAFFKFFLAIRLPPAPCRFCHFLAWTEYTEQNAHFF